jgi:heme A synthase
MADSTSNTGAVYNRGVHLLAKITTVFAFLVVAMGGMTKSKEAGLTIAQPVYYDFHWDWYFIENLNTEYTHRSLVAILSGFTLALLVAVFLKEKRSSVRKLAVGAFLTLIAQAVLGAMTVYFLAKMKTSVPHALLGQTFFALAVSMTLLTSKSWIEAPAPQRSTENPPLKKLATWAVIAIVIQILLGGALRHDNQAEAMRQGHFGVFAWHLMAHMTGMLVVVYFISRILMRVFRDHRGQPEILGPARKIMMLLGVQILLGFGAGILKVVTLDEANSPPALRVAVATTHLVVGALILAFTVVLALRAHRHIQIDVPSLESGDGRVVGAAA